MVDRRLRKNAITFEELLAIIRESDFYVLQIEDEYVSGIFALPFIHKDPFDRFLIATALAENLTVITIDENIQKYDVPWTW